MDAGRNRSVADFLRTGCGLELCLVVSSHMTDEDMQTRAERLLALYKQALSDVDEAVEAAHASPEPDTRTAVQGAIWGTAYSVQVATLEYLLGKAAEIPVPDFIEDKAD